VLFTFSSLLDTETRAYLDESHIPYLVKPFEIGDLIARARKLLETPHAAAAKAGSGSG
jgi:DNA-binding response OmpR family regulator